MADGERPLVGVRVVVTRPPHQAEGLCAAFAAAGASVERLPLVDVVPPDDPGPLRRAVAGLGGFRWIAFTSANAVAAVIAEVREATESTGMVIDQPVPPAGWPPGLRTAAIGEATARALRESGVEPTLIPGSGAGASLAGAMAAADPGLAGAPVLLPLAADAHPDLAQGLAAAGADVRAVVAYDKRAPAGTAHRARGLFPPGAPLGWVTFTSPRIARTFAELLNQISDEDPREHWEARRTTLRAASIGPTTSATLRRLAVEPAAEATSPGEAELVAAVVRAENQLRPR